MTEQSAREAAARAFHAAHHIEHNEGSTYGAFLAGAEWQRAHERSQWRILFEDYISASADYRSTDFMDVGFNDAWSRYDRACMALDAFLRAAPPVDIGEVQRRSLRAQMEERIKALAARFERLSWEPYANPAVAVRALLAEPVDEVKP